MKVKLIHCTPNADHLVEYIARVSAPKNQAKMEAGELPAGKLIQYLADHRHWSPFEMVSACLEIHTTRAIAAQIIRHRSFSFQEFSQRYEVVGTDFEVPEMRRKAQGGNRQGSGEAMETEAAKAIEHAMDAYNDLIRNGVAPESARMVLPMCAPTRLYMHGTIRSWHHYFDQRCDGHAQKEHRLIAEAARDVLAPEMPILADASGWKPPPVNPFFEFFFDLIGDMEYSLSFAFPGQADPSGHDYQLSYNMRNPQTWERDVQALKELGTSVMGFSEPFIRQVAVPLMKSWALFMDGDTADALDNLARCRNDYWKEACIKWIHTIGSDS